jgi:hypothetical protein
MIVNNLGLEGVSLVPFEADPILQVDSDAELTLPVALKLFEPATQHRQISEARSCIENREDFFGTILDRLKLPAELEAEHLLGFLVPAGSDHLLSIRCPAYYAVRTGVGMLPWDFL